MFERWRGSRTLQGVPMRTLSDVADEFLAHQKIYTEDPETTESNLRILKRYIGTRQITDIGKREIEAMIAARLEDGIARSTINRQSATLSKLFGWAIEGGYHPGPNPMRRIKKFRESPGRVRWLSPDEASRLVLAAAHHLKPVIVTALHTGGRRGEILALVWGDVDFDRGFVTFRRENTKSRKERQVPMSPELAATLRRLRPGLPTEPIFCYEGHQLASVRTAYLRACRKAGLGRDVVFHTLRHTFASWWMMNGGDPGRLQRCLGHSSPMMTQRYSHLSPEFIRDGVQFIGPPQPKPDARDERSP